MPQPDTPLSLFLEAIRHLRQQEEMMLYGNLWHIPAVELQQTADFLMLEYATESLEYPHRVPHFDPPAALWGAQTLYWGAQLLLYRDSRIEEVEPLFVDCPSPPTPAAVLSADLCLRFVPDLLRRLKAVDANDPLIDILEKQLYLWHFSAVNYPLDIQRLDFVPVLADACLCRLYQDRIALHRRMDLAGHPAFAPLLRADLGIYADALQFPYPIQNTDQ